MQSEAMSVERKARGGEKNRDLKRTQGHGGKREKEPAVNGREE